MASSADSSVPASGAPDRRAPPLSTKAQWRERLTTGRRALTPAQLAGGRAAVRAAVFARLDVANRTGAPYRNVFAYEAMATEPGSTELLEGLADRGASVYVPLTRPDSDLDWIRWPESTTLGVQAVASASLVLVPALAVDRSGTRLGRGRGCYDRVLARVPAQVPVVALLHHGELVDRLPADPWDRPVTAVVTPDGWYDLRR